MSDIIRIAFVFQSSSFWPTWESLYSLCNNSDQFEVKIFWLHGANGDFYQMWDSEDFLKVKGLPYTRFSYEEVMRFEPDYMVYQTPYDKGHRPDSAWTARYRRKRIKVIYIPYGIEISDMEESRIKHFDRNVVLNAFAVYTLSESMRQEYVKWCVNSDAVKALGMPRFDGLKRHFSLSEEVIKKKGNRKVLLWKAHFPKKFPCGDERLQVTPSMKEYVAFAKWLSDRNDLFVIFMPHPKFFEYEKNKGDAKDMIEVVRLLTGNENVYIDTSSDYRNSLTNADAIIIDRSAVMVEAGSVDVPVLYMHNEAHIETMTSPIDRLLDTYYDGSTVEDMIRFYEKVLSGNDEKREDRRRVFYEVVRCDGLCSERIKQDLIDSVDVQWPDVVKPRFNRDDSVILFGSGNIFKRVLQEIQAEPDEKRVQVIGVADNNNSEWGGKKFGVSIIDPKTIPSLKFRYVVITSENYHREIFMQLSGELKIPNDRIINFDEFLIMLKYE